MLNFSHLEAMIMFVSMIHVFWDMEIPKPSTNPFVGCLELLFVFHDELTFFRLLVRFYVAVVRAFMGRGSIPPYSFVVTNWNLKFTYDLIKI
jgi:hypothetical protein